MIIIIFLIFSSPSFSAYRTDLDMDCSAPLFKLTVENVVKKGHRIPLIVLLNAMRTGMAPFSLDDPVFSVKDQDRTETPLIDRFKNVHFRSPERSYEITQLRREFEKAFRVVLSTYGRGANKSRLRDVFYKTLLREDISSKELAEKYRVDPSSINKDRRTLMEKIAIEVSQRQFFIDYFNDM